MTKIDVISGFLGAGKTTLTKKLTKDVLHKEKIALIRNEFGEVGINGGFLEDVGIGIREMNSGYICCPLVGDFPEALKKVLAEHHPERVTIEPSGVGKLPDVIKVVQEVAEEAEICMNSFAMIADAQECRAYMENFGEFFDNQIEYANTIILSHAQNLNEEGLQSATHDIGGHNARVTMITTSWNELNGEQILEAMEQKESLEKGLLKETNICPTCHRHHNRHHEHGEGYSHDHDHRRVYDEECSHDHDRHREQGEECSHDHGHHHEHGESCGCGHHHDHHHHYTNKVFTSWGMEAIRTYGEKELRQVLEKLSDSEEYGVILRAKGMLKAEGKKWLYFDLALEEYEIREGQPTYTGGFCIIGSGLEEDELRELFHAEQEKAIAVPVYLFTGFLESGKATLIRETLLGTGFNTEECTLLLVCEEGMEGYDDDSLTRTNTALVTVDNEMAMSCESLRKYDSLIEPNRVMVGFNGTWSLDSFMDVEYPFGQLLVQILSAVDTSTFEVYLNNMRSLIYDQLPHSETIIFNRRDETTKKLYLRNNIKATSKGAQLIYETRDGRIVELGGDEMPFDLHVDVIHIADSDYGLQYIDALEYPRKYERKNVELKGRVIAAHAGGIPNAFVFRRYAVVYCADDTSLIGLLYYHKYVSNLIPKDQVSITTRTVVEFDGEYQGDVPVLYVERLTEVPPLDDELVYFNQVVIGSCLTYGHINRTVQ